MRSLATAIVVVLLAAGGVLLWRWSRLQPEFAAPEAPGSLQAPERSAEEPDALRPLAEEQRASVAADATLPGQAGGTPPAGSDDFHGTVVVVDSEGQVLAPIDGSLHWVLFNAPSEGKPLEREEIEAPIHAGQWRVKRAAGFQKAYLRSVRSGDAWLPILEPLGDLALPASQPITIRARRPRQVVLRVVDALTGLELPAVQVVAPAPVPYDKLEHPGADFAERVLLARASSPVALPDKLCARFEGQTARLLVGAEGFAWASAPVDFAGGGERAVALHPGGDLEVDVSGVQPGSGVGLRMPVGEGAAPLVHVPLLADGRVLLRGLPQRSFQVRAELGEWYDRPLILAEAVAEITAGAMTRVALELRAPPAVERASVQGRVLVPREWGVSKSVIMLELLETPKGNAARGKLVEGERSDNPPEGFEEFSFSFSDLQAGRYDVHAQPCFTWPLELPVGETRAVVLVAPPRAEVSVRAEDAYSGEPIAGLQVSWAHAQASNGREWKSSNVSRNGEYILEAPEGALSVKIEDGRPGAGAHYRDWHGSIDTRLGQRHLTARLELAFGFVLALEDKGTRVPVPSGWSAEPEPVEGASGAAIEWSFRNLEQSVSMSAPGIYTVLPPKVEGYRQPPAVRIDVRRGAFARHVVELERDP